MSDSDELCGAHGYEEEPQAVIVDIVDEIEETASPLEHTPAVKSQMPVYCYAPTEVTRLIDSSGRYVSSFEINFNFKVDSCLFKFNGAR